MNYLTTIEVAEKWGISQRRVTILCATGRIAGVVQKGRMWLIPNRARKPEDGRTIAGRMSKTGVKYGDGSEKPRKRERREE